MAQRLSRSAGRVFGLALEHLECRRLYASDLSTISYAGPVSPGSAPLHASQRPHQVAGSTFAELTTPLPAGPTVYSDDLSTGQIIQPTSLAPFQAGVYLTKPSKQSAVDIVLGYLRANSAALQLTPADVANPFVTSSYSDTDTGVTHVYMRQEFGGLPVTNADINATVMADGRLESIAGGFVRNLDRSYISTSPGLSAAQALVDMARSFGVTLTADQIGANQMAAAGDIYQTTTLSAPAFSNQPILAKLGFITSPGGVTLAWNLNVQTLDGKGWWDTYVDAGTGRTLYGANWTSNYLGGGGTAGDKNRVESSAGPGLPSPLSDLNSTTGIGASADDGSGGIIATGNSVTDGIGNYLVYAQPLLNPDSGPRTTITTSGDPKASPYGWQDVNGATGAEYTTTIGNNVSAQDDTDSNNTGGTRPDGGSTLTFNNPIDFSQAPLSYLSASTTNLFYWNNLLHDIHYEYGFNEAAGNFQTNDYGKGGTGNDPVQADAQDGGGFNNANFSTPADGASGRMQMYIWNQTTPNRDGDLDSRIMIHEYGHGISNRLTGGPANVSALSATQSAGMGEGWSDWWSLMLTQTSASDPNGSSPLGTYVLGQPLNGAGIRRYPYSYNMAVDPETLGTYNISSEVHNAGELWATVLWDLNANLIAKYGFSSNLATGYVFGGANNGTGAGNKLALQLVMDALKLQPVNPTFLQARDAIIQADQNLTGGVDIQTIWRTFARRGWGYSASTASSSSTSVTEAYDVPANLFDPFVTGTTPATTAVLNFNSITFNFSEPMKPAFSLGDITSFNFTSSTSSTPVNLLGQITGYSWTTTQALKISFPTQTNVGTYTMTLGPAVMAADNGHALDQNQDGTAGGQGDSYTATITYSPLTTPDAYGYQAGLSTVTVPTLAAGGSGVTSVLSNVDDAAVPLSLGSNSFNFYGSSYSGLFVSSNGLITFNSSNSSSNATNLNTSPAQPAIAPLWQDWVTNTTGNTTEMVLYRTDDSNGDGTPDRLIIQWTDVRVFGSTANGATFSVALQLNTASAAGTILLSYPDLNTANSSSNGGMATTGIKDAGTQSLSGPSRRLLINQASSTNPYVQQGNVVRISNDWNVPTVVSTSYDINASMPTVNYVFSRAVSSGTVTVFSQATGSNLSPGSISTFFYPATNTLAVTFSGFPGGILATGGYALSLGGFIDSALNVQAATPVKNLLIGNFTGTSTATLGLDGTNTDLTVGSTVYTADTASLLALDIRGTGQLNLTIDETSGNPIPATNKIQVSTTALTVIGSSAADSVTVGLTTTNIDGAVLNGGSVGSVAFNGGGAPAGMADSLVINKSIGFTASDGTALSIGGSATATVLADMALSSLTIAPGGSTLDLGTKAVILRGVDATAAAANYTALLALVRLGLGTSNDPIWTGPGITSAVAAADPLATHGVGLIANSLGINSNVYDTFHGFTVGGNDVLLAYTLFGDADLSGTIDDTDFYLTNYGFGLGKSGWFNGDFDYNGKVDDTDFYLLNYSFGLQK